MSSRPPCFWFLKLAFMAMLIGGMTWVLAGYNGLFDQRHEPDGYRYIIPVYRARSGTGRGRYF